MPMTQYDNKIKSCHRNLQFHDFMILYVLYQDSFSLEPKRSRMRSLHQRNAPTRRPEASADELWTWTPPSISLNYYYSKTRNSSGYTPLSRLNQAWSTNAASSTLTSRQLSLTRSTTLSYTSAICPKDVSSSSSSWLLTECCCPSCPSTKPLASILNWAVPWKYPYTQEFKDFRKVTYGKRNSPLLQNSWAGELSEEKPNQTCVVGFELSWAEETRWVSVQTQILSPNSKILSISWSSQAKLSITLRN